LVDTDEVANGSEVELDEDTKTFISITKLITNN
jgi:hypothetical protein